MGPVSVPKPVPADTTYIPPYASSFCPAQRTELQSQLSVPAVCPKVSTFLSLGPTFLLLWCWLYPKPLVQSPIAFHVFYCLFVCLLLYFSSMRLLPQPTLANHHRPPSPTVEYDPVRSQMVKAGPLGTFPEGGGVSCLQFA